MNDYTRRELRKVAGSQLRKVPRRATLAPANPDRSSDAVARFTQSPNPVLARLSAADWETLYRGWGSRDTAAMARLTRTFTDRLARAAGGALRVAKGSFGKVLVLRNTPETRSALDALRAKAERAGNFVAGEPRMTSPTLVVKVQSIYRSDNFFMPIEKRLREDAVHAYLTLAGCRTGADGERWCARDAVPALHWGGYLVRDNAQVSVMEAVEGPELYDAMSEMSRGGLRAVLESLERATFTLWAFGVFHGDLHTGNAILQPDGKVKIIDFGFAMVLDELGGLSGPPLRLSELRSARLHERLETAADEVMRWRNYERYNPNTQQLRSVYENSRSTTPDAPAPAPASPTGRSFQPGDLHVSGLAPRPGSGAQAAARLVRYAATMVIGAREDAGAGRSGRIDHGVSRGTHEYGRIVGTASADGTWTMRAIAFASANGPHRADVTLTGTASNNRILVSSASGATAVQNGSVQNGSVQKDASVQLARAILAEVRLGRVRGNPVPASDAWCLDGAGAGPWACYNNN
jgi:hypothetical protein